MRKCPRRSVAAALALCLWSLSACTTDRQQPRTGKLNLDDFVAPASAPAPRPDVAASAPAPGLAQATPAPATRPAAILDPLSRPTLVATPPPTGQAYSVNAMIGQVNGQPIYADKIFESVEAQLTRLGSDPDIPRDEFRYQTSLLLYGQLRHNIYETLVLGQAERDLTENDRAYIDSKLQEHRQELIRKWGRGSPILADSELREKKGRSLDQTLEDFRQQQVIGRYFAMKVWIKINISRRDIERYYYTHLEDYNPKPGRLFRVITTDNPDDADKIDHLLTQAKPFAQVAAGELNQKNREDGGLYSKEPFTGKLREPLNEALVKLQVGQTSPRIEDRRHFYWLYLESMASGKARPLREVQQEIEAQLRVQAEKREEEAETDKLFTPDTSKSLVDMTTSMVDIAMSRYARPTK